MYSYSYLQFLSMNNFVGKVHKQCDLHDTLEHFLDLTFFSLGCWP